MALVALFPESVAEKWRERYAGLERDAHKAGYADAATRKRGDDKYQAANQYDQYIWSKEPEFLLVGERTYLIELYQQGWDQLKAKKDYAPPNLYAYYYKQGMLRGFYGIDAGLRQGVSDDTIEFDAGYERGQSILAGVSTGAGGELPGKYTVWFSRLATYVALTAMAQGKDNWANDPNGTIESTNANTIGGAIKLTPEETLCLERSYNVVYTLAQQGIKDENALRVELESIYGKDMSSLYAASMVRTLQDVTFSFGGYRHLTDDDPNLWIRAGESRAKFLLAPPLTQFTAPPPAGAAPDKQQPLTPDKAEPENGSGAGLWIALGLVTAAAVGIGVYATREGAMSKNPSCRGRKNITLESGQFGWDYVIEHDDGRTVLVQSDWDYPGTATTFGWSGKVPKKYGTGPSAEIRAAQEWIDNHIGARAEDPGYFDNE